MFFDFKCAMTDAQAKGAQISGLAWALQALNTAELRMSWLLELGVGNQSRSEAVEIRCAASVRVA